jgi:hypothetical protein
VQTHKIGIIPIMSSEKTSSDVVPLIRSLYPDASDEALGEAQQALVEYVAAVLGIFDRIEREREADSHDDANDSRLGVAQ